MIIGLPEQTLETVNDTLDKVLELQPSRVAVFPYAHVPWMKKHQKLLEKYKMPETSLRYEMAKLTESRLNEADMRSSVLITSHALTIRWPALRKMGTCAVIFKAIRMILPAPYWDLVYRQSASLKRLIPRIPRMRLYTGKLSIMGRCRWQGY